MANSKVKAVIKTTDNCPLRCKYCYVGSEPAHGENMSEETLENTITQLISNFDEVDFVWHGGEPLEVGVEFYERAVELEKEQKGDKKVINRIQTNGILLDDVFMNFFKKENFEITLSIDGPKELHNLTRVYSDGSGSFDDVMKAVKKIKEYGIRPNAMATLNKLSLDKCEDIYTFYKNEGIDLKLITIVPKGRAKDEHSELILTQGEYLDAMTKLFDRWFHDDLYVSFDPLEQIVWCVAKNVPYTGNQPSCLEGHLVVNPEGKIYPCGKFYGDEEYLFGNINNDNLEEILNSEKRSFMISRTQKMDGCKPCEYRSTCNSGCMHNANSSFGDIMKRDPYCSVNKALYNHISEAIRNELKDL